MSKQGYQAHQKLLSTSSFVLLVAVVPLQLSAINSIVLAQKEPNDKQQHHNGTNSCNKVFFGKRTEENIACQCNQQHCDHIPDFQWPSDSFTYLRFTSDRSGKRLHMDKLDARNKTAINNNNNNNNNDIDQHQDDFLIQVHSDRRAQQVVGFGGAFTDSATEMISSLEEPLRSRLLSDYFSPRGLDYNMGRVPISGTDMSRRVYSYDDLPPGQEDLELKHFKLQEEDLLFKIPLIKEVNSMRRARSLPDLKLIAASWSAPAWMKSNLRLVQGRLRGNSSNAPYYDAYARYIVRFLREYQQRGVTMWALTPQNEPHSPTRIAEKIQFNSLNFRPWEMADYLANSLIPKLLEANHTRDNLKLFIWDDTLDEMEHYEEAALESPIVRQHMTGTAIHWYSQGVRNKPYGLLYEMRKKVIPPEFSLISTEACYIGKPRPGNWDRGLRYARDIIENLRAGSLAWIDWNLALNMSGGPTWINNILDSAILVDPERQLYYKNPMFYALGHVTRFVQPNSYILPSSIYELSMINGSINWKHAEALNEVTAVAAELEPKSRPLGGSPELNRKIAMVILNRSAGSKRVRLRFGEACPAKANQESLVLELREESITSLAFVC